MLFYVGLIFVGLNLVKCLWLLLVVCDYWISVVMLRFRNFLNLSFLLEFFSKISLNLRLDLLLERLVESFELKDIIYLKCKSIRIIKIVIKELICIFEILNFKVNISYVFYRIIWWKFVWVLIVFVFLWFYILCLEYFLCFLVFYVLNV